MWCGNGIGTLSNILYLNTLYVDNIVVQNKSKSHKFNTAKTGLRCLDKFNNIIEAIKNTC